MKLKYPFVKSLAFALLIILSNVTYADVVEQITVVNHSAVDLKPTAEGFATGCVGGSVPPMIDPVTPDTVRNIDVVFIQYSSTCTFNVLPEPNIMLQTQTCHNVKANDVVMFTGEDVHHLECQVIT
jgi:hypothetical protein